MKEQEDKKRENNKEWKIDPESRKTYKYLDRTPTTLAADLKLPTNTIRNRLKKIGLDDIAVAIKGETGLLPRIFHYEGLPILSAYLKRKRLKRFTFDTRNNLPSFMSQLEENLEKDPTQIFCRKFLYTKKEYQKYLLETHLQGSIKKRLHCIEELSKTLVLQPNYFMDNHINKISSQCILESFPAIIEQLNQLILQLANYADLERDEDMGKDKGKTRNSLGIVDNLVCDWYKKLLEKREKLIVNSKDGLVTLSGLRNIDKESLTKALTQRLLEEALDKKENEEIQEIEKILEETKNQSSYTFQVDKDSKERLRCDIQELLNYNKDLFLKSAFFTSYINDFKWPLKNKELYPLYDMIKEWFWSTILLTSRLQQFISIISVWIKANPSLISSKTLPDTLKEILGEAQVKIKEFWEVMQESSYATIIGESISEYDTAIGSVSAIYQFKSDKKLLIAFLSNPMDQEYVCPLIVLEGCIVTMGYFWDRHVEAYSQYYTNLYEQYLEVSK